MQGIISGEVSFEEAVQKLLPRQKDFIYSPEKFTAYIGGVGCLAGDTPISGIPIAEWHGGVVGDRYACRSFLKGSAPLYRVSTQSGKRVVVTLDHRFLTPFGWQPLRQLVVGSLIAIDENERAQIGTGTQVNSLVHCESHLHRDDELPHPFEAAFPRKLPQLRKPAFDSSAWLEYARLSTENFENLLLQLSVSELRVESIDAARLRLQARQDILSKWYQEFLLLNTETKSPRMAELSWADWGASKFSIVDSNTNHLVVSSSYINTVWDEVCDISYERDGQFYDLTVPGFEHYNAAGIWHHNSGKTIAGCLSMIMLGHAIPNSLWVVGRLNYPSLRDSTRRSFLELFPSEWVAPKGWKESENRLIAKNGAEYLFRHLDVTDADQQRNLMSLNLNGFFMDEATECSENVFLMLDSRLRRKTNPKGHFGRLVGNPAGQDWIYRRFFKPDRPDALARLHRGIIAPTTENIYLDDSYIKDKLATWPQDWIERYIYGSFSDFSDLIYKEWDHNVHTYQPGRRCPFFEEEYDAPQKWPTIVGVDIGGVDPWCWLFIKIAPNGMLFVFDEIYMPHILVRELAEKYYAIMDGHNFEGMAYDYENQQAAFELQDHGINGSPAIKAVKPGIFKVAQYLHIDKRLVNPFTGVEGAPRLFVSQNCPNLIREISSYKWAKDRTGQVTGDPTDGNDHAPDALRYAIHSFRPEPEKLKIPSKWENTELNELSRLFWRDVEKTQAKTKKRGKRYFGFSPVVIR